MKKFLSLVTAIVMTVSLCIMPVYAQTYEEAAADAQNAEINYNRSVPLEVKGNKIVKQGTEDRKSTRLNSSHTQKSRMPSSA